MKASRSRTVSTKMVFGAISPISRGQDITLWNATSSKWKIKLEVFKRELAETQGLAVDVGLACGADPNVNFNLHRPSRSVKKKTP